MLLRIQPDESLRSFVDRNLYLQPRNSDIDFFKQIAPRCLHWRRDTVVSISKIMGWHGCYGFNKLVHLHTYYPIRGVLKSKGNLSYSGSEFINDSYLFDSLLYKRAYCPLCVKEDIQLLGYSYWRRLYPYVTVCAKHNVNLLRNCQFCEQPFSRDGHAVRVMWSGCGGRSLGEARPTANKDPMALRLAQFFERICSLEYHLSAEKAFQLLQSNVKNINYEALDWRLRKAIEELSPRIKSGERCCFEFLVGGERVYEMLELLAVVYESFDHFLADCLDLNLNPIPIDSYWSTYEIRSGNSEHYVKEDYRLGLSSWTCADTVGYSAYQNRRPRIYPCCNLPHPRLMGHQLKPEKVEASLPAVPQLGATGWVPVPTNKSPQTYQSSIVGA